MQALRLLFLAALLAAAGCSGAGIKVSSDRDERVDLRHYSTYAWKAPDPILPGQARNTLLDHRIKSAADAQLWRLGLRESKDAQPDIYLVYHADVTQTVVQSNGGLQLGLGFPLTGGFFGGVGTNVGGGTSVQREGKLTLDVVDARTQQLVWRGVATSAIKDEGTDTESMQSAVDQLVDVLGEARKEGPKASQPG